MAGRRVQYLHPVKMYIFISLVYFVLLFSHSDGDMVKIGSGREPHNTEMADAANHIKNDDSLTPQQKQIIQAGLNRLNEQSGGKGDTTSLVKSIKVKKNKAGKSDTTFVYDSFKIKRNSKGGLDTTYTYDSFSDFAIANAHEATYDNYLVSQKKLPAEKRDGFLKRYFNKKAFAWKAKGGESAKEMINEGIKHNAPKMMFFLLPLFALMLKISFYKNKKFYVEHLIFAFHFHCFLFLFLTLLMLLKMARPHDWLAVDSFLNWSGVAGVVWYLYRSLHVVYKRSVFRTITKSIGLFFSYMLALCFSLVLLLIFTAIISV